MDIAKQSNKFRPQPWSIGEECWHTFFCEQPQRPGPANEKAGVRRQSGRTAGAPVEKYRMRFLRLGPLDPPPEPRAPVVLIHGLMGYSFSWRYNMAELARERTVYAVDLLGIGYSDRPAAGSAVDFSLRGTAGRMLDWLAAFDLRNVDMVGTSHGGALALMMAALDREPRTGLSQQGRLRTKPASAVIGRLVLVAPANPWSSAGEKRIALFNTGFGAWAMRHMAPWLEQFALRRMYGDPEKITSETCNGYACMTRLPRTSDYGLTIVKSWKQDMRQLEAAISLLADVPVLLLWGTLDRAVSPASAYPLKAQLPRSELRMLDGIGHLPYEEAPAQFNELVLEFLDRRRGRSPRRTASQMGDSN